MELKEAIKGMKKEVFDEDGKKKKIAMEEADVFAWKEYEDRVVIVTIWGQKHIKPVGVQNFEPLPGKKEKMSKKEEMSDGSQKE